MLGRLSILMLGIFLTLSNNAQAEPFRLPVLLACDTDTNKIIDMVQSQYGEIPFASAEGSLQTLGPQGGWLKGNVIQTINPNSGSASFSIILWDPETGAGCLVLAGRDFKPALGGASPTKN